MNENMKAELKEKIKKIGENYKKKANAFDAAEKARESGDYEKAKKLYLEAIDLGDIEAANNLGTMYMNGLLNGGKRDFENAEKYYLIGAEKGKKNCYANLGNLYEVRDRDYKKAYEYYLKACDGKYAWPVYKIGVLFMFGNLGKVNYELALHYLTLADKLGYDDVYHLGVMYLYNLGGLTNNVDMGIELLKSRCKDDICDKDSAIDLAWYYSTIDDKENAEIYIDLAIKYGYENARERIEKKLKDFDYSLYGGEDNE